MCACVYYLFSVLFSTEMPAWLLPTRQERSILCLIESTSICLRYTLLSPDCFSLFLSSSCAFVFSVCYWLVQHLSLFMCVIKTFIKGPRTAGRLEAHTAVCSCLSTGQEPKALLVSFLMNSRTAVWLFCFKLSCHDLGVFVLTHTLID